MTEKSKGNVPNFKENIQKAFQSVGDRFIRGLAGDNLNLLREQESGDFDPTQDKEIVKKLNALDEESQKAFYQAFEQRKRACTDDDPLSLKQYALLTLNGLERSAQFSAIHAKSSMAIDIASLSQITPGSPEPLTVAELRLLDRIAGKGTDFVLPGYFTHEYHINYQEALEKLFRCGYLKFSDPAESIQLADMSTLRELAKRKGLKAGGKKADIIQRVLDAYTTQELSAYNLPKRYALTDTGRSILKKNDALNQYYLRFSASSWTTPEEIIAEQNANPDLSGEEILVAMLNKRVRKAETYAQKLPFLTYLRYFCHDETSRQSLERTIEAVSAKCEKEFKRSQDQAERKSAAAFGMTVEELRELREKARRDTQ